MPHDQPLRHGTLVPLWVPQALLGRFDLDADCSVQGAAATEIEMEQLLSTFFADPFFVPVFIRRRSWGAKGEGGERGRVIL